MTDFLGELYNKLKTISEDKSISNSYTKSLLGSGSEKIAKKVIEEAFEVCLASIEGEKHKNGQKQTTLEAADLIYHLLVLLISKNVDIKDVLEELKNREK